MEDGHLCPINVATFCIEHLHENAQYINSDPCCVGSLTRKFEKAKIHKMMEQKFV